MQQHKCQAVAVHCIDFRLQKQITEFLESKFLRGYDRIALAGGTKDLLENGENSIIFKNLQISFHLHQPKTIVLIQHEDCGAYGGSKAFKGLAAEHSFQKEQLQKAYDLLQKHFSQDIEQYLVLLSGRFESC